MQIARILDEGKLPYIFNFIYFILIGNLTHNFDLGRQVIYCKTISLAFMSIFHRKEWETRYWFPESIMNEAVRVKPKVQWRPLKSRRYQNYRSCVKQRHRHREETIQVRDHMVCTSKYMNRMPKFSKVCLLITCPRFWTWSFRIYCFPWWVGSSPDFIGSHS